MNQRDDDSEKEKLSWREIDQLRDGSKHSTSGRERSSDRKSKRSEWALKQYRKEAEKLFMGKKGTEGYKKARNEIHKYHGTPKFNGLAKKFIQAYGLPDDWVTLFLFLDCRDVEAVKETMKRLQTMYQSRSLTEMQGFKAKIEILSMTAASKELRTTAEAVFQEL